MAFSSDVLFEFPSGTMLFFFLYVCGPPPPPTPPLEAEPRPFLPPRLFPLGLSRLFHFVALPRAPSSIGALFSCFFAMLLDVLQMLWTYPPAKNLKCWYVSFFSFPLFPAACSTMLVFSPARRFWGPDFFCEPPISRAFFFSLDTLFSLD